MRRWALASAAAALLLAIGTWASYVRTTTPLVTSLVDKHIAFAQLDAPAEFASADPAVVGQWLSRRAGLRVAVPDYSSAGIRLVGARIVEAGERRAAYLMYEKGMTLLSVFIAPVTSSDSAALGHAVVYRDHEYRARDQKGYRTVSWTDQRMVYSLVSMLDYAALLECADRLRTDRRDDTRL